MTSSRKLRSCALQLALTALFLLGAYFVFKAGERKAAEHKYPIFAAESIIALKDGSTMVAEQGTLGREMFDWVNDKGAGEAKFLLAGQPFVAGSTDPTSNSQIENRPICRDAQGEPRCNGPHHRFGRWSG